VADYDPAFADWNMVSSIGSFVLGLASLIFVYNIVVSWRSGEPAPSNPWRALTIEWQVSSPPSKFNFDEIPQVVGGPYEYGVPGARHAVFNGDRVPSPEPARVEVGH
jgi:cytochrome c oxidase subunit 1